jgi:hypothetical protein
MESRPVITGTLHVRIANPSSNEHAPIERSFELGQSVPAATARSVRRAMRTS